MENKKYILVYGTLRQGERLNSYLGLGKFKCLVTLEGYKMFSNGFYPMIVEGSGKVVGEVYEYTQEEFDNVIPTLDTIESAYTRIRRKVIVEGKEVEVEYYLYNWNVDNLPQIAGGDWKER